MTSKDVRCAYSPVGIFGQTGSVLHTLCYHSETRVCFSDQHSYNTSFPNVTLSVFASLDHLSNLIASNQSQLKSEQDTTILKKGLHEMKEAAAEAKNQADAMQEGIKQLRQESRKNREDEERSQMLKVRELFLTWFLDVSGGGREGGTERLLANLPDTVVSRSVGGGWDRPATSVTRFPSVYYRREPSMVDQA